MPSPWQEEGGDAAGHVGEGLAPPAVPMCALSQGRGKPLPYG